MPNTVSNSLSEEVSEWLCGLAPWSVFFTGTFEGEFSEGAAQRAYERFMRKQLPDVSWFYVTERNPSRAGHHVHAIWADCAEVRRSLMWDKWFKRFGRNRIEPVRSHADVTNYCSKHVCNYLTKGVGWYNVHLADPDLWHAARR